MKTLTDQELEALLNDLESDRAERKQSWSTSAREKAMQAVCAFANDLPNHKKPGVLFVGANDEGRPGGLPISDELLCKLADMKPNGEILPPPTLTVEKRTLLGGEIAVVTVWPADSPPVRYDGRVWVRVGPSRRIATAQDERVLNEKRRSFDLHFEAQRVPNAKLDDLNRVIFETEYLPRAVAPDLLAANGRSYEQRLASCGMIASVDDPTPTVLGLLCLGTSGRTWIQGHYVQFLRVKGNSISDPVVDESEISGTISEILRRLDEKLSAHITTSIDFTSQDTETRKSPYPMPALQQLARNAVMHRTYEGTSAPVRVSWFDDRIEIISPGGPYGTVTADNFGQPGRADYRNPQLAAAFKVLGYAQRFGAGIQVARDALAKNGNPAPVFSIEQNFIGVVIGRSK